MPLFEFECPFCLHRIERFFHTRASVGHIMCPLCDDGLMLQVEICSRYSFKTFEPFLTYNIHPEGKGIYVRDRGHLRELKRQYGVEEHPLNFDPTGSRTKMVPDGHPGPGTKFRKPEAGISASVSTAEQVRPMVEKAIQTDFGRKAT